MHWIEGSNALLTPDMLTAVCQWLLTPADITSDCAEDEDGSKGSAQVAAAEVAPGCARLHDFQSLVERANIEFEKEKIEGRIRSNSLLFNTFIFLQVRFMTCSEGCERLHSGLPLSMVQSLEVWHFI